MSYSLLRALLFRLPPENAHHLSLASLALLEKSGLWSIANKKIKSTAEPHRVMGLDFPNRVGLAAGLDKNGEYIDALAALGFGFVEVGTVTPRSQPGNEKPRLFRLPEAQAIINRMGFNNKGVDYLLEQLETTRYQGILGINIGKNFSTAVEHAVDDYLIGLRKVYPKASYITVNISSPNTPGLRNLQYGKELAALLSALKTEQQRLADQYEHYVPLAVKVAPDLEPAEIAEMADVFQQEAIDAVIATNTTIARDVVKHLPHGNEQGGLSGRPVAEKSTTVLAQFYTHFRGEIPLIAAGGVGSVESAQAKLAAGAELVQIYTGLIYQGPRLIRECVEALG